MYTNHNPLKDIKFKLHKMKSSNHLLWGASLLAILSFGACTQEEPEDPNSPTGQNDAQCAAAASVGSADPYFTSTAEGGTISFKAEGGETLVSVDCGCDWTVDNHGEDILDAVVDVASGTLTVIADRNTVPEDRTATITLMTATRRIEFATITAVQSAYGAPEISLETNELHFSAVGTLSAEIGVEATADWTAEAADEWLTVEKTQTGLSLTAAENEDAAERVTKVTLICEDGVKTTKDFINVSQDARACITLDRNSIPLSGAGDSETLAVESNYDWDFTYDSGNGWFTVSRSGDNLVFTSTADNTTDGDLEGIVSLSCGDGAENVTEVQIKVVEYCSDALVLVYSLSERKTVILPLAETVNCTVDWGDGTIEEVTAAKPSHVYDDYGEYTVAVTGTVTGLSSLALDRDGSIPEVIAVKQWGRTGLTTMNRAFYYCQSLASIPDDTGGAFADVTNFNYAFSYCYSLTSIPDGLFASSSSAKYFDYTFAYCSGLTEIPAGLFAKCSEADTFEYTFRSCTGVVSIGEGLFDGCTKATDFYITFGFMDALNSIPEGLFKNNTAATTFYGVFKDCISLTTVPENLFAGCSKVTTFKNLFYECDALETVPGNIFTGCTAATTFTGAFYSCPALTTISGSLFADCSAAQEFDEAFRYCGLTSVPEGLFANCKKATTFSHTFADCTQLSSVPENLFAGCSLVTTFADTFYDCNWLSSVPENIFSGCSAVTRFDYCFRNTGLTSVPGGLFTDSPAVTNFADVFYGCTSLTEIGSGLFANNSQAANFSYAFSGCTSLTAIPENLFAGCKAVTNFGATFYEDSALTGESAYDLIEIDGQTVKVHIYERENYTDTGYTAPTTYVECYTSCTGLDDYTTIPGEWGGGTAKDLSAVVGTYTVTGYAYDPDSELPVETTWTMTISPSVGSSTDLFIDGLTPQTAGYYPDITGAYIAQAYYYEGQVLIPVQLTGYANTETGYYLGWILCTDYDEDEGWYYDMSDYCTLTYDEETDTWTSDYGMILGLFSDYELSSSYFAGFLDLTNPGIVLKRTSTETDTAATGAARPSGDSLRIHREGMLAK